LTTGCTLETWIAPGQLPAGGGRIIDKSKAGTSDGYLLDTYPGNSLRLIVQAETLSHDARLIPGRWVHVAGTYDAATGRACLYIDGRRVADAAAHADGDTITRGYVLQRWINACGGRGRYPIKFNGSIFTVDAQVGKNHYDADYRRWGGMYWWQNTRLPYWSMLAAGDFDLMQPLFRMYGNCDFGWGNKGPETVNRYIRREWQGGIELTAMMLDYYAITQDSDFLRRTLLPVAEAVIEFYDEHWSQDQNGKIRFEPAQALETWWDCVNPMPEVAGLRAVLHRLLALPTELVGPDRRRSWQEMLAAIPELPTGREGDKRFLLPAERFQTLRNSENPELYAIFPYRLVGLGPGDLPVGLETWRRRRFKGTGGWRQDAIQAAYLGLAEQAAEYVAANFSRWHKGSRFCAFWGPNFDWVPDQDHGTVAMTALQRMLLQSVGRRILILPAWPENLDVCFKLHAPYNTVVQCCYEDGRIRLLKVDPPSRRSDIELVGPK